MKYVWIYWAAIVVLTSLSGCVARGTAFEKAESVPANMASIYFYRPKEFIGAFTDIPIIENGKEILRLKNGQFIRYVSIPGRHSFQTVSMGIDKPIELNLLAGETYYIRTEIRQGFWVSTLFLGRVYPDEAHVELQKCCIESKKIKREELN